MTDPTERDDLFHALSDVSKQLDPGVRTESVAFLLQRALSAPRYSFKLMGPRPSSPDLLTDLTSGGLVIQLKTRDAPDLLGSLASLDMDPQEEQRGVVRSLAEGIADLEPTKVDWLAAMVFLHDLLESTGRPAGEDETLKKFEVATGIPAANTADIRRPYRLVVTTQAPANTEQAHVSDAAVSQ
jgi:hypothetical protein